MPSYQVPVDEEIPPLLSDPFNELVGLVVASFKALELADGPRHDCFIYDG